VRELAPAFLFWGSSPLLALSDQPRTHVFSDQGFANCSFSKSFVFVLSVIDGVGVAGLCEPKLCLFPRNSGVSEHRF
jgi:hypothetical protein